MQKQYQGAVHIATENDATDQPTGEQWQQLNAQNRVYIMRNPTGGDYKAFRRPLDAVSAMQIQVTEDLSAKDRYARHADSLTISQESYISWRRDECGNSPSRTNTRAPAKTNRQREQRKIVM
ncbi:MAG: hypothetical protein M3Z49_01640 [Bifidobacteriales bacterium]|nr:hypothetical protein [Bifidobacteriales bacterium]